MNTINSYPNQQIAFKSFLKPNKQVLDHFSEVVNGLTPENRDLFVQGIKEAVNKAKDCPVPISHSMSHEYNSVYTPIVDGKAIRPTKTHKLMANYILDAMNIAVEKAENKANADANMEKICKIFNV